MAFIIGPPARARSSPEAPLLPTAGRRAYRATTVLFDSRRKRNPHFEVNVPSKDGSGWDAWEFGMNPWDTDSDREYDPATGKQRRKRKRRGEQQLEAEAKARQQEQGQGNGSDDDDDEDDERGVSDVEAATACDQAKQMVLVADTDEAFSLAERRMRLLCGE